MDELEDETGVQRPSSYSPDLPDVEYSSAPAPTTIPTKTPTITPTRPKRQDPFKVPDIKPGEEPAPKAGISMKESDLTRLIYQLVLEAKGKGCAESQGGTGCIKKGKYTNKSGKTYPYHILNNKTGGIWKGCESQTDCDRVLDAYHANSSN